MNAIVEAFKKKIQLSAWICRVTNRVHIAWTQTGRHSILKCTPFYLQSTILVTTR